MTKRFNKVITLLVALMAVAVMVIGGACAKPAPAPAPAPTPTPAPAPAPAPAPKPAWQPPQVVNFASHTIKSVGFLSGQAWGDAISSQTGVLMRFQPTTVDIERMGLLRTKEVQFLNTTAEATYSFTKAIQAADVDGWGPQRLRILWLAGPTPVGMAVRKNSGIKVGADLKGKRVVTFPGYPTGQFYVDGALAFFNLKKGDYSEVPVSSSTAGEAAFLEGKADTTWYTQEAGAAIEMAASPNGLFWLPMDPKDTEGWKRLIVALPIAYPLRVTEGPGAPADIWGYDYHVVSYDWQSEDLVYWLTKQKTVHFNSYKDIHPALKKWTMDNALKTDAAQAPFHPGAIRYYKEIGVWTAQNDAWQKERLALEEKYIADWKAKHPTWKWDSGK